MIRFRMLAAACIVSPTLACAASCPMTYAQFQAAIPHVDLDICPDALAGKDRFCRASIAAEQLHVFAFDFEGDKCLVGMTSLEEGQFSVEIKKQK